MANPSIYAAFERMWQQIVSVLGGKVNTSDLNNLTVGNATKAGTASALDATGVAQVKAIKVDDATSADKVAYSLKFGDKTYNGSSEQTITASDLGLESAIRFVGMTSTAITDGGTQSPVVDGETHIPIRGDVVINSNTDQEFIWNGSAWEELGNSSSHSIKGHTHTVIHKPTGTVSKPTFSGTEATISSSYTPAGTVSKPTFTGTEATLEINYTPAGTVSTPTFTGSAVNSGKPTGTNSTTTIYSITGVGSLPSLEFSTGTLPSATLSQGTLPSASISDGGVTISTSVSSRHLTVTHTYTKQALTFSAGTLPSLTFSAGTLPSATFSAGSLPTRSSAISMPDADHVHSVTAAGTISQPTFAGTADTVEVEYTPAGSVSQPTFTGTAGIATATYTPTGSVSQPTFTGTSATITTSGSSN